MEGRKTKGKTTAVLSKGPRVMGDATQAGRRRTVAGVLSQPWDVAAEWGCAHIPPPRWGAAVQV